MALRPAYGPVTGTYPEVGDHVLISLEREPRIRWREGDVIGVIPGRDGKIHAATVATRDGCTLTRPTRLLHRLGGEGVTTLSSERGRHEIEGDETIRSR